MCDDSITRQILRLALEEDRAAADITTNSLADYDRVVAAQVTAKEDGVISGTGVFHDVFITLDPLMEVNIIKNDGAFVAKGDVVIEIKGMESTILKGERTALNFLQRLSGIASLTRNFIKKLEGCDVTLLDTRKTTPGMRTLEKKAVKDGGGTNHRMNLEDMAMIKDNHIRMAGSITAAIRKVRQQNPGKKIEVEVKNPDELDEALSLSQEIDIVMLDNFEPGLLPEAIKRKRPGVKYEISGNVNLENIKNKAVKGIDYISVGALTHSFKSLDLSLNIIE